MLRSRYDMDLDEDDIKVAILATVLLFTLTTVGFMTRVAIEYYQS